jgi:phosphoribosylformylglycinamidine synthase
MAVHAKVASLVTSGKVFTANDVSDGGLAVAVAEMCIASNLGASLRITSDVFAHDLFADVPTTYVLEMSRQDAEMADLPIIGDVTGDATLSMSFDGGKTATVDVEKLASAWRTPLADGGGRS